MIFNSWSDRSNIAPWNVWMTWLMNPPTQSSNSTRPNTQQRSRTLASASKKSVLESVMDCPQSILRGNRQDDGASVGSGLIPEACPETFAVLGLVVDGR